MKKFKAIFTNDDSKFIYSAIIVNTITIFLEGFDNLPEIVKTLVFIIDSIITGIFVLEAYLKIRKCTWKVYISKAWNRFDFLIVVLTLPSILLHIVDPEILNLSVLFTFRILRVLRLLKILKFTSGIKELGLGIARALKTSVVVFIGFIVFNIVISILSCFLFKQISPDYFGDPLKSFYSIFRIFTVEGWYEIPDKITEGLSAGLTFFIKFYFIIILISGGIFGLSIVNSIFVDAMISDNTDKIEDEIEDLNEQIKTLHQKIDILLKNQNK